jgi:alkanesulfonate monooxygenase SsuD/methylene tetrahydromethanopterin reductase-like flavin-dependent oxidoreductase (luciferase family)
VLVRVVEIALPQCREHAHVPGVRLGLADPPRGRPPGYLVGQRPRRVRIAARGGEHSHPVPEQPRQQPLAAARASEFESVVGQLLSLVPPASQHVIET